MPTKSYFLGLSGLLLSAAILPSCAATADRIGAFADIIAAVPGDLTLSIVKGDQEEEYVIPDACLTTFASAIDLALALSDEEAEQTTPSLTDATQAAYCTAIIMEAIGDGRFKADDMTIDGDEMTITMDEAPA